MASPVEHTQHDPHDAPRAAPLRPDDTPPRNRVIFTYTLLAVITLYALEWVFESYIDTTRRDIRGEHIAASHSNEMLADYRETQHLRLASGPMPIERAIEELGRRGRSGFPLIRPTPSADLDPLRGWTQLPRELPPGLAPAEPEAGVVPAGPEGGAIPPAEGALPQGTLPDETAPPPPVGTVPAEPAAGEGAVAPVDGAAPGEGVPEPSAVDEPTPTPPTPRTIRPRPVRPAADAPAADPAPADPAPAAAPTE